MYGEDSFTLKIKRLASNLGIPGSWLKTGVFLFKSNQTNFY